MEIYLYLQIVCAANVIKNFEANFLADSILCYFYIIYYFCNMKKDYTAASETIILGIDPGTNVLGYGLMAVRPRSKKMLAMGVIDLRKVGDAYLKLGRIYQHLLKIIDTYHPDELAIEAPFYGKNVQSMLKLGRAQGVVIAAAIARELPVYEYTPKQIKQAVTGTGAASKEQLAALLPKMLDIDAKSMLPYLDATDALGAAYCHYLNLHTGGVKQQLPTPNKRQKETRSDSTWEGFVKAHAERISTLQKTKNLPKK